MHGYCGLLTGTGRGRKHDAAAVRYVVWLVVRTVFIPPHHHPDAAGWSNVSNSGRCCMHAAGPAPIQRLTRAPDNGLPPPPPRRQVQIERGGWCGTALALPACARPRRVGRWLPACGLPVALARVRQAHFVRRAAPTSDPTHTRSPRAWREWDDGRDLFCAGGEDTCACFLSLLAPAAALLS
jgi:hypothetical protein